MVESLGNQCDLLEVSGVKTFPTHTGSHMINAVEFFSPKSSDIGSRVGNVLAPTEPWIRERPLAGMVDGEFELA